MDKESDKTEPMTSVIAWTRYDGTPETLPKAGVAVFMICGAAMLRQCYSYHPGSKWHGGYEVIGDILPAPRNFSVGDLWAYLPKPPEVDNQ